MDGKWWVSGDDRGEVCGALSFPCGKMPTLSTLGGGLKQHPAASAGGSPKVPVPATILRRIDHPRPIHQIGAILRRASHTRLKFFVQRKR